MQKAPGGCTFTYNPNIFAPFNSFAKYYILYAHKQSKTNLRTVIDLQEIILKKIIRFYFHNLCLDSWTLNTRLLTFVTILIV